MIALAVAVVLVALIARDVVLRVMADRAAQRLDRDQYGSLLIRCDAADHRCAQLAAALDAETARLSEVRADVNVWGKGVTDDIAAIKGEVAVLKTTSSLRGPR